MCSFARVIVAIVPFSLVRTPSCQHSTTACGLVYDLVHNHGFVNVGIDHDTAEFAVESIRRWWRQSGKMLYPDKNHILITADGGGSNGVRNRLWKKKLQELADEEQLTLAVVHYPPATSKWNKIEHRLFSFISINWRAQPLTSLEVVLELLSHTSTKEGLTVTAVKGDNVYPIGRQRSLTRNWLLSIWSVMPFMGNGTTPFDHNLLSHKHTNSYEG
jgi:hypothetical protein